MSMDICSRISLPSTDNTNDLHGFCSSTIESTHGVLKVLSVDNLSVDMTKFLNIQDAKEDDSSSLPPRKSCDFQKNYEYDKSRQSKISTQATEDSFGKFATCSSSTKTLSPEDAITSEVSKQGDNVESLSPSKLCSTSMPTHLKPVSAMKGSREKWGVAPPVKLTVKWAPDVYDPIPTSVSHVVTSSRSSRHSKKNSRNKQKSVSKSSRGSKGKEKKQVRKRGGHSSGMSYKLDHEEELVDFREHGPQPGGIDFHVRNPDQLCGSSFLKSYGTRLHLSSVAEAT